MSNSINRRRFLRRGFAGAAGTVIFSGSLVADETGTQEKNIVYRTLGKTGLKVPVVSFGVMRADSPELCKAAYENGINFFDTANGYQNGNNETMLGNLFKNWPRSSFIVETKIRPAGVTRDGLPTNQTTAESFLESFNISLSRLQVEYVDILLIHDVSKPDLLKHKPLISALSRVKKEKKTRFIGFSTHNNMAGMLEAAAELEMWDVVVASYNFRIPNVDEMNKAISKAAQAGIGIIAMKTLAGGGFLDKEKTKPMNTSAAIKWALSNPNISAAIPGMTTFDHLVSNLKVLADPVLTEAEKKDLLAIAKEPGMFCRDCKQCLASCPFNLPIPDLMRAYMYAYGYSNLKMAYELLGQLGTGITPCVNCKECTVNCSNNFNVREKITDVSRIVGIPADLIT
ncbi:MAG TPA: aldo/keto reductase [Bacteroidales bacterium]|nr:aldo/keto reductase [Bacteroidales bacterium]HCI56052.1 oxidoreductase [Bacteroidales bacterium]HOU95787.1 aldo/keto reductase [Bacteroidales bacterium]HQG36572.1 aldo/keto reductase [Bacteroidales bacterium]HQG52923.1 aldo/keto reductase [Bacteroidales bacterium]